MHQSHTESRSEKAQQIIEEIKEAVNTMNATTSNPEKLLIVHNQLNPLYKAYGQLMLIEQNIITKH